MSDGENERAQEIERLVKQCDDFKRKCEKLAAENNALRHNLVEEESAHSNALYRIKFLEGQIEAYQYCLAKNRKGD